MIKTELMKQKTIILLLGIAVLFCTCHPKSEKRLTTIWLASQAPEALIQWYVINLNLKRSPLPNDLRVFGDGLEIEFSKTDVKKAEARTAGFFKFGFSTNQFDEIYELMKANGVSFRGTPFYDDNLKQRSFLVLDADGNRIQFFEDADSFVLKPTFFSVIVRDFEIAKSWYENELGFVEHFNLDLPQRNLNIRLLKKEIWLLELIGDNSLMSVETNSPGISAILLSGRISTKDPEGNLISR